MENRQTVGVGVESGSLGGACISWMLTQDSDSLINRLSSTPSTGTNDTNHQSLGRDKACDRPRPTQGLPGPSGPEPRKSPKRVRKEYPGKGHQKCPKSAPRSLVERVRKSLKPDFRTLFGLFWTPGRTLWELLGPCPGVLFPDSSGVPGPKGQGDPVWGGADRKIRPENSDCRSCKAGRFTKLPRLTPSLKC